MYALLGIDAVLRITAALVILFVAVPALARRRPAELDRMLWFWWCFACGVILLTIGGQLLTLLNVFNTATLLLAIAAVVLLVRSRVTGRPVTAILQDLYRSVVLFSLNVLEGRVDLRRRFRRMRRRMGGTVPRVPRGSSEFLGVPRSGSAEELRGTPRNSRNWWWGWAAVILVAAAVRLYRPFASANLGYSDTYVHLYLMRLLEQGRQVDPAWGPYPRGMHFLLHAIRELTNVDAILLMNFFGAIAGVLMTLAVADTARRLTGRLAAGVVAGLIFATMVGGASQYFVLGGSMATDQVQLARDFVRMPYADIPPTKAEFDVLLTVFQRQTATLPQELAIVFLFPAVMFLFRGRSWWDFTGYLFCTSAIAAIHPGVALPLVLLSGITVLITRENFRRAIIIGALGILLGSTWMLGYIAYPNAGSSDIASASGARSGALYYFPFLRSGEIAHIVTWVAITPFLVGCLALAILLLLRRRRAVAWASAAAIVFLLTHVASRFGWPEIVEVRRNASWLAMALAILIGVATAELMRWKAGRIAAGVMVAAWLVTVPLSGVQHKLINYSGYGATAYAVIEIQRKLEPFTWTLVTYGQEFPMVLGKGFHLTASDFLDRYDPAEGKLEIPTRYVFIAVEKKPHPFEINTWSSRFSRADVQQRLQTWCFLYQLNHKDMRVFLDDENVRVYVIERNPGVEVGAL